MKRLCSMSLVLMLCAALAFTSCSSSTSSTPTTGGTTVTIDGTTSTTWSVSSITANLFQVTAINVSGSASSVITMDFNKKPTSNGTYSITTNVPSNNTCMLLYNLDSSAFSAMDGGTIQVTVSGSTISFSFTNVKVTNMTDQSQTKTITATLTLNS